MTGHPLYIHFIMGAALLVAVLGVVVGMQTSGASQAEAFTMPPYCVNAPEEVAMKARAAYGVDLLTGRTLYDKNADVQLPLASITKVMTVATASEYLADDGEAVVTREALSPEGDSGLFENERWRVSDLMDFTLMTSANDGAHALALAAAVASGKDIDWFVREMNARASSLGLAQTFFVNDTGLDVSSTTAGAYGSAKDVAEMLWYAAKRERSFTASSETTRTFISASGKKHKAENTTTLSESLPGTLASKTGFTDLAGGNLVIVFEPIPGRPVAAAILGTEREERDSDMLALAGAVTKELKRSIACESYGH